MYNVSLISDISPHADFLNCVQMSFLASFPVQSGLLIPPTYI